MFTLAQRALPASAAVSLHLAPISSCFLTALLMLNSSDRQRACNKLSRTVKASNPKCLY